MECASCKLSNLTEHGIACRLCEQTFHLKCVNLTGRLADALVSDIGVFWLCANCRKANSNMFDIFNKTKAAFKDVRKDLAAAQAKLDSYEQLFENFLLDNVSNLPKKSKRGINNNNNNNKKKEKPKNLDNITIPDSNIVNLISLSPSLPIVSTCSTNESTCKVKPGGINSLAISVPNNNNTSAIDLTNDNTHSDEQPCCSKSLSVPVPATDAGVNSITTLDKNDKVVVNNKGKVSGKRQVTASLPQLRVSKPRKSIFISRLSEDTLETEISNYIVSKSKHIPQSEISVKKFKFSYKRQTSSFKISVPLEYYDSLMKESYWPKGIVVHEFVMKNGKQKKIVSLPAKN